MSWMANLSGNEKIILTHVKVQKYGRVQRRVSKLNLKPKAGISAEFGYTVDEGPSIYLSCRCLEW